MDINGRGWRVLARSVVNTMRNMDVSRFSLQFHPGATVRKYRISWSISNGNKSAALRLVDEVASRKEAKRLVDYLLRNRTTITQHTHCRHGHRLRHYILDKALARLVLEFGLHEVNSSAAGETPGLVTMATWLEHATFTSSNGRVIRNQGAVYPLSRTLSALLESGPDISGRYSNLAQEIYCYLAPALVTWFYRGHPVNYKLDLLVTGLLFRLLKLAGPNWTLCPERFLCVSPMLQVLREVRPWRLYESSSITALSKMLEGFFSLMFDSSVLGPGWTIPEFRVGDLLEILGDLLSGVPAQPNNDHVFRIYLSLFCMFMYRLQDPDGKHKANRRHLIKLAIWCATFLPRHDCRPSNEPALAQLKDIFPTFVWRIRQPLSLKQNCAITIRRHLGFKRLRQILQLGPLPPGMERFIEKGFFQVDDALVEFMASERLS